MTAVPAVAIGDSNASRTTFSPRAHVACGNDEMLAHDPRTRDRDAVRFDRGEARARGRAPVEHEIDRLPAHRHAQLERAFDLRHRLANRERELVAHVVKRARAPAGELARDPGLERRRGEGGLGHQRGDECDTGDSPLHFAAANRHGSISSAITPATSAKITASRAGHGPRKSTIVGRPGRPGPRKP